MEGRASGIWDDWDGELGNDEVDYQSSLPAVPAAPHPPPLLPLGDTALRGPAAMVNLLGTVERRRARLLGADRALSLPDVHLHLYGKASVRPRRKMGHVNRLFPLND